MKRDVLKKSRIVKSLATLSNFGTAIRKTQQHLYVTKKQLEHLNAIEAGKEVFLSCFYASQGGGCWALRTENGLLYVPWMDERSNEGVEWLKELYAISGR